MFLSYRVLSLAVLTAFCVVGYPAYGAVHAGEPVPDFALPTVEGKKTVHLSDFRGKKVILFAWASW